VRSFHFARKLPAGGSRVSNNQSYDNMSTDCNRRRSAEQIKCSPVFSFTEGATRVRGRNNSWPRALLANGQMLEWGVRFNTTSPRALYAQAKSQPPGQLAGQHGSSQQQGHQRPELLKACSPRAESLAQPRFDVGAIQTLSGFCLAFTTKCFITASFLETRLRPSFATRGLAKRQGYGRDTYEHFQAFCECWS